MGGDGSVNGAINSNWHVRRIAYDTRRQPVGASTMTENAPTQRLIYGPGDSAPNAAPGDSSSPGAKRADIPPRDDVGHLLLDDQWRIIAADEQSALTGGADAAQFVGQPARDVIGDEALATLATHGAATFVLDDVEYALALATFVTPTGLLRLVRVQETQATLERMISLIVHEVRNPLMAMRALAQGLAEDYADTDSLGAAPTTSGAEKPNIGAYTGRLIGEIDRLGRLLASMAQIARPGERPMAPLDPIFALERVAAIFRADLERRGVTLRVHVTPHTTPILADADQIQQALVNLITNALEAMPQGGALTLRARLDPRRRPVIQVEDTGVGMTPEAIERAFRPRQSAHSSKSGGMGLGLMVVGSIVRQSHGQLRVASVPGQGTTISITFPRVEAEQAP